VAWHEEGLENGRTVGLRRKKLFVGEKQKERHGEGGGVKRGMIWKGGVGGNCFVNTSTGLRGGGSDDRGLQTTGLEKKLKIFEELERPLQIVGGENRLE